LFAGVADKLVKNVDFNLEFLYYTRPIFFNDIHIELSITRGGP
jgi:hypothetical protein